MKRNFLISLFIALFLNAFGNNEDYEWIRINQLGYKIHDIKVAVFISTKQVNLNTFRIVDVKTGVPVYSSTDVVKSDPLEPFVSCYRLYFTKFHMGGTYKIIADAAESGEFRIDENVYDGAADYLLNYMRQQRSGFNPYVNDSCHTHDGYVVYGNESVSGHVNVSGGWHDAADYLQYVATSANATYQMLFAYSENPAAFKDNFLANGLPGKDGVPDILNEIKWGLDWLMKMNPSPGIMFNQIADDRDHIGFRFPDKDTANYGKGKERPVYLCTGKPQGLFRYKNRTTGIASTAGKFASAFARGASVYRNIDPSLSEKLLQKAVAAFSYGLENPGVCQTAPGTAPYFYEEDNWVDDMELAAGELYNLTKDLKYLTYAREFGRKETVTPWMGKDTALHYQWYPFVNLGHPLIARHNKGNEGNEFAGYMKRGLELIESRARKNVFHVGIPFIWCSNNYVAAALTQAHLYCQLTSDSSFTETEAAHRDWLFGCNPWGTSMIVGLPHEGVYPGNSHSSYVVKGGQVFGGLVDGPVYPSIFNSLKYIYLSKEDKYSKFQSKLAVYHDDFADYSTNECTMDGTASLTYYLSALQKEPDSYSNPGNQIISRGAIIRMDTARKQIFLCFTAHDRSDGFKSILKTLKAHNIKASFFLTGDFCRDHENKAIIHSLKADGHYIGPHSDKHVLYCSWEKRDSLLIDGKSFTKDLDNNYTELARLGISRNDSRIFLPAYEWYNDSISSWTHRSGSIIVNMSPGTITSQDWTYPELGKTYYSSRQLMDNLFTYEKQKGMNGYILLIHPGTDPRRKDKFYLHLDSILNYLESKKYTFHTFSEINKTPQ